MIAFAESIGAKDPKYFGENPVAHPAYIGTFVVSALFALADVSVKDAAGNDQKMILKPTMAVHGGQGYKYHDVPVKDGEIIILSGALTNAYIKNDMLFVEANLQAKKEDGTLVQDNFISAIVRKGGF